MADEQSSAPPLTKQGVRNLDAIGPRRKPQRQPGKCDPHIPKQVLDTKSLPWYYGDQENSYVSVCAFCGILL